MNEPRSYASELTHKFAQRSLSTKRACICVYKDASCWESESERKKERERERERDCVCACACGEDNVRSRNMHARVQEGDSRFSFLNRITKPTKSMCSVPSGTKPYDSTKCCVDF